MGQMSDGSGTAEAEKRKPGENDVVSRKQKKAREEDNTVTTTEDEEVEEFFAILKRIHVAIGYFKKEFNGRQLTGEGSRLRTMLETENYEGVNGVKGEAIRQEDEGMEENLGFDLNVEPGPDSDPV